jgi:hypothetical protein
LPAIAPRQKGERQEKNAKGTDRDFVFMFFPVLSTSILVIRLFT